MAVSECGMCLFENKKKMKGKGVASAVPEAVMDAVKQTLGNIEGMQSQLHEFLALSDPDVLSQMQPLQRAQSLFLLAKITTTLFACMSIF